MDKKEIKAIDASIEHWEEDIIKYLLEGRVAYPSALGTCWEDDNTAVPSTSSHCPLCNAYLGSRGCKHCPYKRKYGRCCDEEGEAWIVWYHEPTLENALAMVGKLKGLLPGQERLQTQRLVRRYKRSIALDFAVPVRCGCKEGNLVVIDHRTPGHAPAASREWRYEVTCDACLWSDANGYRTKSEIIAEYPAKK